MSAYSGIPVRIRIAEKLPMHPRNRWSPRLDRVFQVTNSGLQWDQVPHQYVLGITERGTGRNRD